LVNVVTARLAHTVTGIDAAPVVVLGSSLGTTRAMWDPQVASLAERFRVISYDHRGHGESEVPAAPYQIADLGGDVLALLDDLGVERFSYVGISLGGMTGMWIASEVPARVDRLALLNTSASTGQSTAWQERAASVRAGELARIAPKIVGRWFTPSYAAAHPDVVERVIAVLLATPAEGYVGCCEAIAEMDLTDRLAAIGAPTLVMAARQDTAIPSPNSETIAAAVAGARLELIDDAAHIASVEQPAVVTRLLIEHLAV
jgi:3-oxoadipate enol-lactonase